MATSASTFFVQNAEGDFELVIPRAGGGVFHFRRHNQDPAQPWTGPSLPFGSAEDITAASLVVSSAGGDFGLAIVALEGDRLLHYWRPPGGRWIGPVKVADGVSGPPALIQAAGGDFHVVAPLAGGGLAHWSRDNAKGVNVDLDAIMKQMGEHGHDPIHINPIDIADLSWSGPTHFGEGTAQALALIERAGNLVAMARQGSELVRYSRHEDGDWTGETEPLDESFAGGVALIQSSDGTFDLVAALEDGGLGHWSRDGLDSDTPWEGPTTFGEGAHRAVSLIQGTFGDSGLLEVVSLDEAGVPHAFTRDEAGDWQGPVRVQSDPCPETGGQHTLPYRTDVVGIHAALLHTGQVVIWAYEDFKHSSPASRVFDPLSGSPMLAPDLHFLAFCGGQALLPDGRLLTGGGMHQGVRDVCIYDPGSERWTKVATMDRGRWYPTCTTLPDGRVFIISGTFEGLTVEIRNGRVANVNRDIEFFDPGSGLSAPIPIRGGFSRHFPPEFDTIDLYPFVYVLPDGRLAIHSRNATRIYDPNSNEWDPLDVANVRPQSRSYPLEATSVLLPLLPTDDPPYRPRILIAGGGDPGPSPATASVEILDLSEESPAWRETESMAFARVMPDGVLLPDGTVMVVGGSATGEAGGGAYDAVLEVEVFDPVEETWQTLCPMAVPRLYHSAAILLPTAQVLMLGKDAVFNNPPYKYPEHRAEIFSPPYLFRGERPSIFGGPEAVGYGDHFGVGCRQAETITAAAFIRPGNATHSFNMDQRYVGLNIVATEPGEVTLEAPPNANLAPPGYYMLFLLNGDGVPSDAIFIHIS
jgi:hypothetical protein